MDTSTGLSAAAVTAIAFEPSGASTSSTLGVPPSSCRRAARTSDWSFLKELVQVERAREHGDVVALAFRPRPLFARTVAVQLDPVVVRIAKADRLAHAVVARTLDR